MEITLQEKLGLHWKRQPVLFETGLPLQKKYNQTAVYINNQCIPSDLFMMEDRIYASFAMELEPYSKNDITFGPRTLFEPLLIHEIDSGSHIVRWLGRSIEIPLSGLYKRGRIPSFFTSLRLDGEEFISGSGFDSDLYKEIRIDTKFLFEGYQFYIIQVDYFSKNDSLLSAKITINGQFPEILISEIINSTKEFCGEFHFSPNLIKARAKIHTPKLNNFNKDFWERIEFSPKEQNRISFNLQPFYAWDINAGTFLAAETRNRVINIVPVHASKWENGNDMRLNVSFINGKMSLKTPGLKGKREWIISIIDGRENQKEISAVKFSGGYNNYHYQIDKELNSTYYAERIIACSSAQSINKLFNEIKLELNNTGGNSSGVLINRAEIPNIRRKYENDEFVIKIMSEQHKDVPGFDMAGAYLLNNDENTAFMLARYISDWFDTRIGIFFNLGYSSVHLECIALSRPLRDIAIDLDIISGSIEASVKERLYYALAYLSCIIGDKDYWPRSENGFNMGNKNFHSDMYACLGVCACVLKGHEKTGGWIDYVVKEFDAELDSSIYPGGAWAEAPTYQLASLSHLLVLAAALKNCGYKNFFLEPRLIETMMFLYHIQTPVDPRCGFAMIPSIGDTTNNILTQSWQALFAWVAKNTYIEMPEFSALMMRAWIDGGRMRIPFSYNSGLKLALVMLDPDLPAAAKRDYKSTGFEGFGAILKKKKGGKLAGYLAIKAGEINNHYDHDEGTLIWYSHGVPLLVDYGTQYNPGVDQSFWHNRISIDHKSDWSRGEISEFETGDIFDYIKMCVTVNVVQEWPEFPSRDPDFNFRKLPDPYEIPKTKWTREVVYLKEIDSLVIMDEVGGSLPYDWNLHVLADSAVKHDGRITFRCMLDIEMDVHLRLGTNESVQLSKWEHRGLDETRLPIAWRDYSWMWDREINSMGEKTRILRIEKKAPSKFIAILSARNKKADHLGILYDENMNTINITTQAGKEYTLETAGKIRFYLNDGDADGKNIY